MEDVSRKLSQKETNPLTTKLLVSPDKAEREMVKNQFSKFELSDLKLSPAEYAKLIKLQDKILSDNYTIKEYKQAYDFLASR